MGRFEIARVLRYLDSSQSEAEGSSSSISSPAEVKIKVLFAGDRYGNQKGLKVFHQEDARWIFGQQVVDFVSSPDCESGVTRALAERIGLTESGDVYEESLLWRMKRLFAGSLDKDVLDDIYGHCTSCGSENNLTGMNLAKMMDESGVVIYSKGSHYSVNKYRKLLRWGDAKVFPVNTDDMDRIDITELKKVLAKSEVKNASHVVLILTMGTTITGVNDPLECIDHLRAAGITHEKSTVVLDAAFHGLPYALSDRIADKDRPYFTNGIDMVCISLHKFLSTPHLGGVFLYRKRYYDLVKELAVDYIRSADTTVTGGRNGHAMLEALIVWLYQGVKGLRAKSNETIDAANQLIKDMAHLPINVRQENNALTVFFDRKDIEEWMLDFFALAPADLHGKKIVHICVTPSFVKNQIWKRLVRELEFMLLVNKKIGAE